MLQKLTRRVISLLQSLYHKLIVFHFINRFSLKYKISKQDPLKIIIGAGGTGYAGWVSTDYPIFDVLSSSHWKYLLGDAKVEHILAEHVFEHLSSEELLIALANIKNCARNDIVIRIAVPDGNFPDINYIRHVEPGGMGPGAYDHKILYTKEKLGSIIRADQNWVIDFVEYWTEEGEIVSTYSDYPNGKVMRCLKNDNRNTKGQIKYTSLIVDLRLNV